DVAGAGRAQKRRRAGREQRDTAGGTPVLSGAAFACRQLPAEIPADDAGAARREHAGRIEREAADELIRARARAGAAIGAVARSVAEHEAVHGSIEPGASLPRRDQRLRVGGGKEKPRQNYGE